MEKICFGVKSENLSGVRFKGRPERRMDFPGGTEVKNLPTIAGYARDMGSTPGLGRFPRGGNDNPL